MASAQPDLKTSNGLVNRLRSEDQPVHAWYRFVLSFPPHLVRDYLSRFDISPGQTVLDPFCGTGTVLVECKKRGVSSIGVEAHPMARFATGVKVDWDLDPDGLLRHAKRVCAGAEEELKSQGIQDMLALPEAGATAPTLRTLSEEESRLLLKGSISPRPLHKALVLRDRILNDREEQYRDHELLALATAICTSAANLHFGPEVGVTAPKADAPVLDPWMREIEQMSRDLRIVSGQPAVRAEVYLGDSRSGFAGVESGGIDAVITSPPYPNEKDYTRIIRLESILLGFVRTKAQLRALKHNMVRSNTRTIFKGDDDDEYIKDHPEVLALAEQIERRRVELGKTSGFERRYAAVTKMYFGGMKRHLEVLRQYLAPGAHLAYVVGDQASYFRVLIQTGRLLARIAAGLGYEIVGTDLFRTRLATATRKQLREEVLVLRWPGPGAITRGLRGGSS